MSKSYRQRFACAAGTPPLGWCSPARRAARGGRAPGQGIRPLAPSSFACAAGGKGHLAPRTPGPGCAPGNPDSMQAYAKLLARMLMDRSRLAADDSMSWYTVGMRRCIHTELRSHAGGLGARCAPNGEREGRSPLASRLSAHIASSAGSARGGAASHDNFSPAESTRGGAPRKGVRYRSIQLYGYCASSIACAACATRSG